MRELLGAMCAFLQKGLPVATARVIEQRGSSPRGAGACLLADADGLAAGTVGGGAAEALALEACRAALTDGRARLLDVLLSGKSAAQSDMICGGRMRILAEPFSPAPDALRFFHALRDAACASGAVYITDFTDLRHPRRSVFTENGMADPALFTPAVQELQELAAGLLARRSEESVLLERAGREYFLASCLPPHRLFIAGGGHVSRPTAQIAAMTGFEVTVLDDRPEFSRPERFPQAARTVTTPEYADCFASLAVSRRDYIVIVTRGHMHDAAVLEQALRTGAGYIGMIGSTRKRGEVYAALRAGGVREEELARVSCPVGLSIGAETPEEIAVSILAECIAHRRNRNELPLAHG